MGYKNHPNRPVTIYRAIPKEVKGIKPGDWVAVSRKYAVEHGKSNLKNSYKIQKKLVYARDIFTDGNSEWGYFPQPFDKQNEIERRAKRSSK